MPVPHEKNTLRSRAPRAALAMPALAAPALAAPPRAMAALATPALAAAALLATLGCTAGSAASPSSSHQQALTAPDPADAPLVLDDFTTAPGKLVEDATATQQAAQVDPAIRGGARCLVLVVTGNRLGRPVTLEVRDGKAGYLALDSGVGVDQAMLALYGYDEQCNPRGLDLDLTDYDEFRIDVDALDLGTAGGVVVWSDTGASSAALSIDAGVNFTHHLSFGDFTGDVDWKHVQQIAFEIQSGGAVAAHDYALRGFSIGRAR